ncbi:hypothetical protein BS78_05G086800 [Paspalum vaginatum]|nr:hypothetical protein BS78_05G086800 [Paspalum vaginatum]
MNEHRETLDFAKFVCIKQLCLLNCLIFFRADALEQYSCEGTWPKRYCHCFGCGKKKSSNMRRHKNLST